LGSKAFPADVGGLKAFFGSIDNISGFRCTVGIVSATQLVDVIKFTHLLRDPATNSCATVDKALKVVLIVDINALISNPS
jgi:hypothetical protein